MDDGVLLKGDGGRGPGRREGETVGLASKPRGRVTEPFSGRNRRLAPTLVLACVVLLAPWMGNADGGYFVGRWAPAALILAGVVLVVSALGPPTVRRGRPAVLALAFFALYTAWTFASLAWSPDRGSALFGAAQTTMYLLAFWAAVSLVVLGASRRWVMAVTVLGPAAVAGMTLIELDSRPESLIENGRLVGTMGYHNGEAAFLLVSLWVAVYLGGSRRVHPALRGAVLAAAVLSASVAVLTQSRGAMVATAVSLPVFFLLSGQRLRGLISLLPVAATLFVAFPALNGVYLASFGAEKSTGAALEPVLHIVWTAAGATGLYGLCWGLLDRRWRPSPGMARFTGWLALVAVFAVAILVVLFGRVGDPKELAHRKWEVFKAGGPVVGQESRYLSASGSGRYELWKVALKDFAASPVYGVGTHNYEATYYALRDRNVGPVRQLHSLPLEVLAERGIVGGALLSGFLIVCLGAGLKGGLRGFGPEEAARTGALAAAATYWFVHASAEWFWQMPAVTLPATVYLALLVSSRRSGEPSRPKARLAGVVVSALAFAVLAPLYVSDLRLSQSRAQDPGTALAAVERAGRINPLDSRVPRREAELATDIGDWERAEGAYDRLTRLSPAHYAPHVYRATYYERRGKFREALHHYRAASALNPLDDELRQSVERLQDAAGGRAAAPAP